MAQDVNKANLPKVQAVSTSRFRDAPAGAPSEGYAEARTEPTRLRPRRARIPPDNRSRRWSRAVEAAEPEQQLLASEPRGARRASLRSARYSPVLVLGVGPPPVLVRHLQEAVVDQLVHAPELLDGILLDSYATGVPLQHLVALLVLEGRQNPAEDTEGTAPRVGRGGSTDRPGGAFVTERLSSQGLAEAVGRGADLRVVKPQPPNKQGLREASHYERGIHLRADDALDG